MPFALDSNPSNIELSDAINYLLANFGANLSADPNTGVITGPTGQTVAYLYKYLSIKYADSFDGALNFSNSPTDRLYYGARNSNDPTESTNPADYIWLRVAGGFGTTKFLFYKVSGGRQIEFFVGTTAPAYAWVQESGPAIDLDALSVVITATPTIYQWTATSTPPARPTTATTYNWLTGTYTAPAGWDIEVPSNTTPNAYLWAISITIVQTGGINTSTLDWTNPAYAIRAVGYNGANGATGNSALTAYRVQDQASATPTFTTPTSGPSAPSGWTLATPAVAVGQVLWYIQGEYNSSTTLTINGVAPNTTRWTGPIAASVFQDIRSDNWNGSNPPSFANPATWGTTGYYIERTTGTAILNNLGARGTLQSGSNPAISGTTMTGSGGVINSDGTFALGNSTANITFNGSVVSINNFLNASTSNTNNTNPNLYPATNTILTFVPVINKYMVVGASIAIDVGIPLADPAVSCVVISRISIYDKFGSEILATSNSLYIGGVLLVGPASTKRLFGSASSYHVYLAPSSTYAQGDIFTLRVELTPIFVDASGNGTTPSSQSINLITTSMLYQVNV